LGGLLFPQAVGTNRGVHIVVGQGEAPVLAPVAPGLVKPVPVASACLIEPGETVVLSPTTGTIAVDGEREHELLTPQPVAVTLNPLGPWVIDIDAAMRLGASHGLRELGAGSQGSVLGVGGQEPGVREG
jgi:hypothetical protein